MAQGRRRNGGLAQRFPQPPYCKLLIRNTADMPRNNVRADSCYQKAVEYLVKNPNLTVQEGMTLADFSPHEREDKAKYMMVICLLNKIDKTRNDVFTTPPALSITVRKRRRKCNSG
jgi:hypothetical protein